MIKVTVLYPRKAGARFDHEYYLTKHVPLVATKMGKSLKTYEIDKGLAGEGGSTPAPYVAMVHLYCDSIESFQAGFGPHAGEILADVANYTDLTPVVQISEVVVKAS